MKPFLWGDFPPLRSYFTSAFGLVGFIVGGIDATFGIQQMTRVEYETFLQQLTRWIGPITTIDPMFWMWRFSDFAFGMAIVGLVSIFIYNLKKIMNSFISKIQKPIIFIISIGLGILSEYLNNKSLSDIYDLLAISGGVSVYFIAEWIFHLIRHRK